ncbi:RNA-binding S4 domain-containing protein [Rhodocyclus tenuis]|uniref:Ribosome-associated heat shock protein Hsp15 n=1 Tax=Rhodocyclus tenuis TaxID=1066 RepID=A0A840G1G8_RHOTE|nr:S4 domain-containing protein [Rhodocyclus tenuis]MBB4245796.1 ribosome-associated heat shock protein Hsp15 [Rhodocyclus tenuis]
MRVDKWLWAARCYKTRSLASDAVDGGKVKLNGSSVKPAKEVKIGDCLRIRAGDEERELIVKGLNEQRRPAPEAQLLYEETAESLCRRTRAAELRKLAPTPTADQKGRPTKRDRRQLNRLHES